MDDLVDAFLLAQKNMDTHAGHAFNIGGGPRNTVSLLELLDVMSELLGRKPDFVFDDWRTGDQRYYVSNTGKFEAATGWKPRISIQDGLEGLLRWLVDSRRRDAVIATIGAPQTLHRKAAGAKR